MESPEINLCIYGQSIYTKDAKIYNGEKTAFNKLCWENWTATCKIMKLKHSVIPYTKSQNELKT